MTEEELTDADLDALEDAATAAVPTEATKARAKAMEALMAKSVGAGVVTSDGVTLEELANGPRPDEEIKTKVNTAAAALQYVVKAVEQNPGALDQEKFDKIAFYLSACVRQTLSDIQRVMTERPIAIGAFDFDMDIPKGAVMQNAAVAAAVATQAAPGRRRGKFQGRLFGTGEPVPVDESAPPPAPMPDTPIDGVAFIEE